MATFGDFVKREREKRNWTQTEFGARLGINSAAICRIENNNKQLSPAKLKVLAEIFAIDLVKIKELYFADKFAREAIENNCPENVFIVAEKSAEYLRLKKTKQMKLDL
jgi:transcriptional regulator with XRE-family HTH domain